MQRGTRNGRRTLAAPARGDPLRRPDHLRLHGSAPCPQSTDPPRPSASSSATPSHTSASLVIGLMCLCRHRHLSPGYRSHDYFTSVNPLHRQGVRGQVDQRRACARSTVWRARRTRRFRCPGATWTPSRVVKIPAEDCVMINRRDGPPLPTCALVDCMVLFDLSRQAIHRPVLAAGGGPRRPYRRRRQFVRPPSTPRRES